MKIRSIRKGFGESSIFFTTDFGAGRMTKVDEIKEELKYFGKSEDYVKVVYRGYVNNEMVFEMDSNDTTIIFWTESELEKIKKFNNNI